MAQVPVYGGPQLRTDALRTPMQGNVDVSSGLQSLARGVGAVGEVVDAKVQRDAKTEADSADAEITGAWLEWDAKNRLTFTGERAKEYEPAAADWWNKARETYGAKLSPMARAQIGTSLERKRSTAMASVMERAGAEQERHSTNVYDAAQSREIELAADTGNYAGGASNIRVKAAEFGAARGWKQDQVDAEIQRRVGALHLTAVEKLAATSAEKATAYYEANKGEIPAAAQNKVEAVLKAEGDNQFATRFAAQNAGLPLSEQTAKASAAVKDPERLEKTLQQIRNTFALKQQAQREAEQGASDDAWQMVGQGRRVPEATLQRMNGRERVQLQDYLRERAKQAASGTAVKTDWATYIDARERLAAGQNVDLRPLTTKIAPAQMEQLLDIKTKATTPGKQDSLLTDEQRINQALVALGIDKKNDPASAAALAQEVDRRVRVESAARGGKDLTADEKQKLIDSVVMDRVYVDEWGRDPEKSVAMLTPEEMKDAYVRVNGKNIKVSTVPMSDRQNIIAALRAVGQVPTEQAIVNLYLRGQNKQAASGTVK